MKIADTRLQMTASHTRTQQHDVTESLKMWVGQQRPTLAGENHGARPAQGERVTISNAGQQASETDAANDGIDATVNGDSKLSLIRTMLEYLTGRRIQVFDASNLSNGAQASPPAPSDPAATPSAPAGYGVEYDYHESYAESEQTAFSASGTVRTTDGREIGFDLQLSMSRSYYEENNISLRLGDAARKTDPLVLNFSGTAAQLTDQRFAFDLNADGRNEQINFVAPGSGFLVFDRNGDGKINNGQELFGPTSGDGFQELSALDDDGNGWIDEGDAAFQQLQVWTRNSTGSDSLQSLQSAGVGAISLNRIATPFDIKSAGNTLLGQIRSSGIFLQESGSAGTIQQIDLTA